MSLEKINTATRPIPNKYVEAAASPTSRKVLVTMNRDLWTNYLSDGQKRNGISQKDREELYLQLTQQWCLRYPIERVSLSK